MIFVSINANGRQISSTEVRFDANLPTKMRSNRHGPSHCAHNNSQNEFPVMAEHSHQFSPL
jgi:hypothetical protein